MTTFDHLVLDASLADADEQHRGDAAAPPNVHWQPGNALARLVACVGAIVTLTEAVLWRLTVLKLVAAANEARYTSQATAEVEAAAAELAEAEAARTTIVDTLATEMGVPAEDLSLAVIAGWAPEGVATALTAYRRRLNALASEMQSTTAQIRRHVSVNLRHLDAVLGDIHGKPATYNADGRATTAPTRPRVQRSL
jgi:hypothetical protein